MISTLKTSKATVNDEGLKNTHSKVYKSMHKNCQCTLNLVQIF